MRRDLVIERPELQDWRSRYGYGLLTLLAWLAYVYLWLPLISLAAWSLGIQLFYRHMIVLEGYKGLLELLGIYAAVIALLSGIYLGWAIYNWLRFRGVDRRQGMPPVTTEELATRFGIDPAQLEACQQTRRLRVHHDKEARITAIDRLEPVKHLPVLHRPVDTVVEGRTRVA
ncbi:MAG: poly-beta-1,6-N-acetyl-D-glucosamine biosynthesis protein PgaD [Gammaproteobacteria bacterium]|nr:MAG: poly-beta-1,6-N-acetyl-D-glucosamine biosynthesis protein PgaD [Gammaproteobacteria bacterium]